MILNDELLKKTKLASQALAEAEHKAELARAEYNTAIRRLHLASGSLREVAQAVGLSHQRIQQIVDGAGGSWWSRIWRSRNVKRDTVCTFCERPPSEVASLVAGPNVFVCDGCIGRAERAASEGTNAGADFRKMGDEKTKLKCSFCGKPKTRARVLIVNKRARVCGECLGICRQILTDQKPRPARA